MKEKLRKALALLLSAVTCLGVLPVQALAAGGTRIALPEAPIDTQVLQSDVFYVASPSAQLAEGSGAAYLLRIGRGGDASSAASVHVRIADVTAKYGEDYTVRVYATGVGADNPDDNLSLMEMMAAQPFTQTELGTEEELAALLSEDEEGRAALNEGVQSAVDFLDEASGLEEKYPDGYPADTVDEVQQARAAFTGVDGTSQRLTSQSDAFEDLQSVADVLTTAVVGADLTLDFAPGEREQYLELIPRNNRRGDGDRLFYLVLNSPEGGTTVSAADSCAVTIVDDEEQECAVVSFSDAVYRHVPGAETVTVTVERSGALNTPVSVVVRTAGEGTALAGRDYSEVDRSLMFPFGVSSLTVDIPVRTEYFSGSAEFSLTLEADSGCTVGLDTAVVFLTGTRQAGVSLMDSEDASVQLADAATVNSLATLKTLDAIDVSRPNTSGHQDNKYGGNNSWDSGNRRWKMDWEDNSFWYNRKGTVGAVWQLSQDEGRYWIAGAQVVWERSGEHAEITVDIDGRAYLDSFFTSWKNRGDNGSLYDIYRSTAHFGKETVNFYPTESSIREHYSFSPKWISFYNRGRCDDCNWLWIYSIKPILRPFNIIRRDADKLAFLQEDGSYAPDDGTATRAEIVGSANGIVCFLNEGFTVHQPSGSNVQQYAMLRELNVVDESGNVLCCLGKNTDAAVKDITYTLSKENLTALKTRVGTDAFRDMLKKNTQATGINYGYPNYCELNVKPVFDYIDSSVTLHNPYDFSVEMDISGKTYSLAAHESRTLTFHLGDRLALTEIRTAGLFGSGYTAVGASVTAYRTGTEKNGEDFDLNFVDSGTLYLGGSNTGDHRLCCRALTVEPNLQEANNRIIVRVKTSDLPFFDRTSSASLLSQAGVVSGGYAEFLVADSEQTVNGKLYALTAAPADGYVCLWNDKTTDRNYEGNTFYFTAGDRAERNVITLSAAAADAEISLEGTLYYMNYNLHDLDAGGASALPAAGAVVAAGSASAAADERGFFRTGKIPVSAPSSARLSRAGSGDTAVYLRYLVSVNGNALVREVTIPQGGGALDVSDNFSGGVSPVNSEIFNNIRITAAYPADSGYDVANGTYLPIVQGLAATMTVDLSSVTYKVNTTGETGVTEQTLSEHPTSVLLTVYDAAGKYKGAYSAAKFEQILSVYRVTVPVDFAVDHTSEEGGEDASGSFAVLPGDRLYLRLTTDRLAQAGAGGEAYAYTYSDIYTGFTFIEPTSFEAPVAQGIENPVDISYPDLPLLGNIGMNLDFPFVTVGWTKIARGYRMYIGVSAAQIYDKVKDTKIASYEGEAGVDWGSIFSLKHPFSSFAKGIGTAYDTIKGIQEGGAAAASDIGSKQWKFDLVVGAYFDFFYAVTANGETDSTSSCCFAGVGFYMSASLGFKISWYFVIPVVFIPAYICVDLSGTVMGFLGAAASGEYTITQSDARKQSVDFNESLDEFSGSVRGIGTAQLSVGVGLCGTLGIRAVGSVNLIAEYAPSDLTDDIGAYIEVNAGITVDLFLLHVPLTFKLAAKTFGSFADYESGVRESVRSASPAASGGDPFRLRPGSEEDSVWRGSDLLLQSALTPTETRTLSENAYERGDAQLITLSSGTVVLAFIDSDNSKGPYQRTTLKLATYRDGVWSEPVAVWEDDTADFQPSLCETKDGGVLVAWVSSGADDLTEDTSTVDYLHSMEVFAKFVTVNGDGSLDVHPETEPEQLTTGTREHYYDSNPTVVCDRLSGDAIVYYVKSGSTTADASQLANPYTNDCVICYLYYNAEADDDNGSEIPAGWLKNNYYSSEYSGTPPDSEKWGGQRFLRGPSFLNADGNRVYYAIPDFTAVGYNGLAVFAYTVDTDGSSDTDSDKELYLQVFNFAQHELKYRVRLTEDAVADALPQFFRAKAAGISTDEEGTHTKLFWYRDGKDVCYLDVTRLIREGIEDDGTVRAHEEDYTDESGRLHSHYTEPHSIGVVSKENQMANFRVAEDKNGSLYVVWTEGVRDENGDSTEQLFAMGMYAAPGEDGAEGEGSTGWSKPRRLTEDSLNCDEPAVTVCEDGLMVVHNSYQQTLNVREAQDRFEGVVDYDPIEIGQIRLTATMLEPCGAVETDAVSLTYAEDTDSDVSAALPEGGRDVLLSVSVTNNGLTAADGYQLTLYAVQDGNASEIGRREIGETLMPAGAERHTFAYTLPENVEGLSFRAVTQELHSAGVYYENAFTYETEPLECRADYTVSDVLTVQTSGGFRLRCTLTNNGNAPGENDTLRVRLSGPFNLDLSYPVSERLLAAEALEPLAVGESRSYDLPVSIPAKMLEKYGFIDASVDVVRPQEDGAEQKTGEPVSAQFTLTAPLDMAVESMNLAVDEAQAPQVRMTLAQRFGSSDVVLAVADQTVAAVRNGKVVGVAPGTTTLYATHPESGAVTSAAVTVYARAERSEPTVAPTQKKQVRRYESFTDLAAGTWYEEGVRYALEKGIMNGVSETAFAPAADATRATAVTMLWRLAGEPGSTVKPSFTDAAADAWYSSAISWAVGRQIATGLSAERFAPDDPVSREQLAVFLYRYARAKGMDVSTGGETALSRFTDGGSVSSWAEEAMRWAVENGILNGVGDGKLDPAGPALRAQVAAILMRFDKLKN